MAALGNAIQFRMPAGFPGVLSRQPEMSTVEAVALDPNNPFAAYGRFGKTGNTGLFRPIQSGDAAALITGLLVKPFPTQGSITPVSAQPFLVGTPPQAGGIGDRLKRGYMSVFLNWGAAIKDGQVYVCNTAAGSQVVGDIGADTLSGNAVAVTGCFFTGPSDTTNAGTDVIGVVEIAFNL